MRLDKKLNLVIPLERENETAYVHAMPVSFATFELFSLIFAKTYSTLMSQGLGPIAGPSVAMVLLKETAENTYRRINEKGERESWLPGPDGVELGLLAEIRRLTNYLYLDNGSWTQVPLEAALSRGILEEEEVFEVNNQLAFFTVVSHAPPRGDRETLVAGAASMFNGHTTLLNCTDYLNSLPTSKEDDTTQMKGTRSSIPSSIG